MARDITAALNTEFNNTELYPIFLFKSVWNSGTVYLWTGYQDLSWDGQTWSGAGHLLGVGAIKETSLIEAAGANFSMSGIPGSLVSLILDDARQGNEVSLYVGAVDNTGTIIVDPYKIFSGLMDVPSIQEDGENSTISLSAENRLIELDRAREIRYTNQVQQRRFSGDLGLEYVASLQNKPINWGKE